MAIVLMWIVNALALLIVASIVPGFAIDSFYSALIVALILGLVNAIIRPLVLLFTLPINILTLGLFTFVVNALMLTLVSSIVKGFTIESFSAAIWAAIVLWIVSFITNLISDNFAKNK